MLKVIGGAMIFYGFVEHIFYFVGVRIAVVLALVGKYFPLHDAEATLALPNYVPHVIAASPHHFSHPLPHPHVGPRALS